MSATLARFQPRIEAFRPRCAISVDDLALVAAHDRDAGLDLVDADLVEVLGDLDLLGVGEDDAGGLLAVAQRRVVELDLRACRGSSRPAAPRSSCASPRARTSSFLGGPRDRAGRPGEYLFGEPEPAGTLQSGRPLYRSSPTVSGRTRGMNPDRGSATEERVSCVSNWCTRRRWKRTASARHTPCSPERFTLALELARAWGLVGDAVLRSIVRAGSGNRRRAAVAHTTPTTWLQ